MASNKGRSTPNLSGGYNHYDSHGRKTGYSSRNLSGGYNYYDAKGNKTGYSARNLTGGYTHYDNKGHKTGRSSPRFGGGYTHYDNKGNRTGSSSPSFGGGYTHSDGCYIATCVYGSYDCPEVRVLRRFRDEYLKRSVPGRNFVRFYYAVSPVAVHHLGRFHVVRRVWKRMLDPIVTGLRRKGY